MTPMDETAGPLPPGDLSSGGSPPPQPPAGAEHGLDPELLDLPRPPQSRRAVTLALMALVVAAAAALAFSLRHDLAYFFSDDATVDLGSAVDLEGDVGLNRHVTLRGTPMLSRAVRYRQILTGSEYVVFPLAGQRAVYVQVAAGPNALARTEFSGRLATFGQLGGRADAVRRALSELGSPVTDTSRLLLADEPPGASLWALVVAALCGLFILVDLALLLRWFLPLPS